MTSTSTLPTAGRAEAWRYLAGRIRSLDMWRKMCAAMAMSFGASGCQLIPPLATGVIIDDLAAGTEFSAVLLPLGAVLASLLCGALLMWWGRILFARVAEPLVAEVREEVVAHAVTLDAGITGGSESGDALSRISDDSRLVSGAVSGVLPQLLSAVTLLIISIPGLFSLHWALGVAGMIGIPMYAASLRWYLPRSAPLYRKHRELLARRTTRFLDAASGRDALEAQGWTDSEVTGLDAVSDDVRRVENRVYRMLTRYFQRNNRAEFVVTATILIVGFFLVQASWSTVGTVTAAALLFHRLFDPVAEVIGTFDKVQEAGIALRRLVGVLSAGNDPRSVNNTAASVDVRSPRGLALDRVSHSFDGIHPVLDEVSLTVMPGQCVAVVGTTGAGKTTLVKVMSGMLPVQCGAVTLDADVVSSERSLVSNDGRTPRRVVMVSQQTHVFTGTMRQNLTLGCSGGVKEITNDVLEQAAIAVGAQWILELPEGFDTRVGIDGLALNPHQAQHLALVRVVLINPDYVVLDEATAEDGSTNSMELDRAARQAIAGRGALVVAHRLSQARLADTIVVMDAGRVVESGQHEELVAGAGRYATLWRAWIGEGY